MPDFKTSQNQQFTSDGICFIPLAPVWTGVGNPRPKLFHGTYMLKGDVSW